jgi:hypothetical protein
VIAASSSNTSVTSPMLWIGPASFRKTAKASCLPLLASMYPARFCAFSAPSAIVVPVFA